MKSDEKANNGINLKNIYLVGNPNSGKTSLFNGITGERHHVGNWPGVTVEKLEGVTQTENGEIRITDLPGTYSLSPATPEEALVLKILDEASKGTVLNVVDSTNMVRNLFLTTQLIELGLKPVISLNCYDGFTEAGGSIDLNKFKNLSGCEAYPTVARTNKGIPALVEYLSKRTAEENCPQSSMLALPEKWQKAANQMLTIEGLRWETATPTQRYAAISKLVRPEKKDPKIEELRQNLCKELTTDPAKPVTTATLACELAADRYHRIEKMVPLCAKIPLKSIPTWQQKIDSVLVHKFWGIPIFALLMFFVFWTTFTVGQYPMDWLEAAVDWLSSSLESFMKPGLLRELVIDGGLKSVGSVIVFIPNIIILFFWIVLLEDSGYMSRAAFIIDRLMKSIGLQGRAFIPMVMGIGCNVPAVMATRIIDSKFQRMLTMFLIPMVSCSARLPILVLLCGTFFPENPSLWMFSLFFISLIVLFLLGHFASLFLQTPENSPFMLEMPPYRLPTTKSVFNMLKEKAMHFLEKAGTIVLAGSVVIWALSAFPRDIQLSFDYEGQKAAIEASTTLSDEEKASEIESLEGKKELELTEARYMGRIGKFLHPIMEPFGFTWRETVSLIPGLFAKESVVSTLTVLYLPYGEDLGKGMKQTGMTPLKAFIFMLFTLLYVPCLATIGILWRESGSTKFTIFSLLCYFGIAYGVSFAALKIGEVIISRGSSGAEEITIVIMVLIAGWVLISRLVNGIKGRLCGRTCGEGCSGCKIKGGCSCS